MQLAEIQDPTLTTATNGSASPVLSAPRFFADLLDAVMDNTPVDIHQGLRKRRYAEPEGGMPPPSVSVAPEQSE